MNSVANLFPFREWTRWSVAAAPTGPDRSITRSFGYARSGNRSRLRCAAHGRRVPTPKRGYTRRELCPCTQGISDRPTARVWVEGKGAHRPPIAAWAYQAGNDWPTLRARALYRVEKALLPTASCLRVGEFAESGLLPKASQPASAAPETHGRRRASHHPPGRPACPSDLARPCP